MTTEIDHFVYSLKEQKVCQKPSKLGKESDDKNLEHRKLKS